jgi:meiotically up-regulated gene 157 (Mug157) protein
MLNRRSFVKTAGLATAGLAISMKSNASILSNTDFTSMRPALKDRNFVSKAVEDTIVTVKKAISDPELAWLFENCFPNTLDTTVKFKMIDGKPDTFVITGDINAMWLRDSTAQVWPYLPLTKNDNDLKQLVAGVINRQVKCIQIDSYANAFNDGPGQSEWLTDLTDMKPELHERKWEIDSLCYPVRLSYGYWKTTGDSTIFDDLWVASMKKIYKTFVEQQRKDGTSPYKFGRVTAWALDTVPGGGYGNPIKPVGLICSMFRPSDDATTFPFLVPSNYFAVVSLKQLSEIFTVVIKDVEFANKCKQLALEVENALKKYAITDHLHFGSMLAYEVDGFGNQLFMDDANVPSLLALPYLGAFKPNDPLYLNTRKFSLSDSNPYFFMGKVAKGVGGPHSGMDMIWPLSFTMKALTSTSDSEIKDCIRILRATHAGTGFMHESFFKDDANKFTRKWFAWANTLFGEMILKVYHERPHILKSGF